MSIHQLHPHGHPMPVTWQDRLHAAESESEVVAIARDFIAEFAPREIAMLPEACRPPKLVDGNDITDYAFSLIRHRCDDGVGAEYAVHRLSAFFSGATSRLAQILHVRSQPERDSTQQSA
jgi:hypothetical protein